MTDHITQAKQDAARAVFADLARKGRTKETRTAARGSLKDIDTRPAAVATRAPTLPQLAPVPDDDWDAILYAESRSPAEIERLERQSNEWLKSAADDAATAPGGHFTGHWPDVDAERTCKHGWRIWGEGETVLGGGPQPWDNWRGFTTAGGGIVYACPHCKHERVLSYCRRIETASGIYLRGQLMLRYVTLDATEAKRMKARIRKHRQAGGNYNYASFPLDDGRVVILHDDHDEAGEQLPTDRGALYELVRAWVLSTPKGKRAGHGLANWGTVKRPKETGEPKAAKKAGEKERKRWHIRGAEGWHLVKAAMEAEGVKSVKRLKRSEIVTILDAAGVEFEVDGFTLNRVKTKKDPTKCESAPAGEPKRPKKAPPEPYLWG